MKYKHIEVRAACAQQDVLDNQCDEIRQCDTIKEAKYYAYMIENGITRI